MKKLIAVSQSPCRWRSPPARSGLSMTDSNAQQIVDEIDNLVKYAQMINNQVQQIQTLTSQLTEFKNYEACSAILQSLLSMVTAGRRLESLEPG